MPEGGGTWRLHKENVALAPGKAPGDCAVCLEPIGSVEGKSDTTFTEMGCCSATLCEDCFVRSFSRTQACPGCRAPLSETRRANGIDEAAYPLDGIDTLVPLSILWLRLEISVSNGLRALDRSRLQETERTAFSELGAWAQRTVDLQFAVQDELSWFPADIRRDPPPDPPEPPDPVVEDGAIAIRWRRESYAQIPRGGASYAPNGPAIWERQLERFWAQIPRGGFFSVASPQANSRGVDERTREMLRQFFERRFGHPLEYRQAAIEPNLVDEVPFFPTDRSRSSAVQDQVISPRIGEGEGLSREHYGFARSVWPNLAAVLMDAADRRLQTEQDVVDEGEDSDESAPELE